MRYPPAGAFDPNSGGNGNAGYDAGRPAAGDAGHAAGSVPRCATGHGHGQPVPIPCAIIAAGNTGSVARRCQPSPGWEVAMSANHVGADALGAPKAGLALINGCCCGE